MSASRPARNHPFDLARMVFASMVLLAHAPELSDGNRSREIVARLTHNPQYTFGMVGVDGFFLLSGYLITQSWMNRPDPKDYFTKRFMRIAPAYAVVTVLATFILGVVAPAEPHFFQQLFGHWFGAHFLASTLFIIAPFGPPVFPGNHYHSINGALWTILYEFRCYVVVALFGMVAAWTKLGRWLWLSLWPALTALLILRWIDLGPFWHIQWSGSFSNTLLGSTEATVCFASSFFLGGCYCLFARRIRFVWWGALACAAAILAARFLRTGYIENVVTICGSYLLFYFGSKQRAWLKWMEKVPDLSYGIYLYGWPVENWIIWKYHPSPWTVFVISLVVCTGFATLSWTFIESPALQLARKWTRKPAQVATSTSSKRATEIPVAETEAEAALVK